MQKELRDLANSEHGGDVDIQRWLWYGRALASDFSVVPALAAVADQNNADGRVARAALAALFGEEGEMSLAEFRNRLESALTQTRSAAKPKVTKGK